MLKDAQELSKKLNSQVNAEKAGSLADRIQKHSGNDLTTLCDFNAPQRVRRLTNIPPKSWGLLEERWAASALLHIEQLKAVKGDRATLALACYGIERDGLSEALKTLGGSQAEHKPAKAATVSFLSPEQEEEIDQDAQATLESLRAEVGKLAR